MQSAKTDLVACLIVGFGVCWLICLLFLHRDLSYGYLLEVSQQVASDEYPQYMFLQK